MQHQYYEPPKEDQCGGVDLPIIAQKRKGDVIVEKVITTSFRDFQSSYEFGTTKGYHKCRLDTFKNRY